MNELIKQLIILLATSLFTLLINKFPDFPIGEQDFVNFFIWLSVLLGLISGLRYQWYLISSRILKKN